MHFAVPELSARLVHCDSAAPLTEKVTVPVRAPEPDFAVTVTV